MHPILVEFGSIRLYTYGLFIALGFLTAVWFTKKNARFYGISQEAVSDLFFTILIASLIGARLLYVTISFEDYRQNPLDIFKIWNGGLVFFGGFLAATLAAVVFCRMRKLPVATTADVLAPGLALGHAIGRLGCFFAGCCYGKTCDLPFAVTFSDPNSLAPLHTALHPTQIYMAVSNLVLFFILLAVQRRKRFEGMVFLSYVILYAAFRFVIEFFRGDFRGDFFFEFLSVSQGIGIVVSVAAVAVMIRGFRSGRRRD